MNSDFEIIIGLEVHVQLNTNTKLFCSCATSFNEEQNKNTCPTCLALPGALPVVNHEAVNKAIMLGTAVNATIDKNARFDRKNYIYPDSPSAYQITQFYRPIIKNGYLEIELDKDGKNTRKVNISEAHLEADAGKNIHESSYSKVDLNRAGTPLLEIVTAPDMRSSDEAVTYLKKLHSIVRYLDISDANMQEGSFRCDANVSIRPKGDEKLYTRVEIKNINSFRFVQKAIEYEIERHIEAWEDGVYDDEVYQETRLYDPDKNETRSMRGKEEAADYRYFPEPDLAHLDISDHDLEKYSAIPELPDAKRDRFIAEFGLKRYDASVITSSFDIANYFEVMLSFDIKPKNAVTWLTVELLGRLNKSDLSIETSPVEAKALAELVQNIENGSISGKAGKEILDFLFEHEDEDLTIEQIIDKLGLKQVNDEGALLKIIDEVIAKNGDKVEQYKSGKDKLFGFFVGQTMKASKGSANPQKVNEILKEKLAK
jgi:aspartyl-tRNA(Asn)/glutamyl-tRNA(Gln) amidotransferase subunit B